MLVAESVIRGGLLRSIVTEPTHSGFYAEFTTQDLRSTDCSCNFALYFIDSYSPVQGIGNIFADLFVFFPFFAIHSHKPSCH